MLSLLRNLESATPSRPVWLTEAARYIVKRRITVTDLFDLTIDINEKLLWS